MVTFLLEILFHKGETSEGGPNCGLWIGLVHFSRLKRCPRKHGCIQQAPLHCREIRQSKVFLLAEVMIISCPSLVIPLLSGTFELPFICVVPFRPEQATQRNAPTIKAIVNAASV